MISSSFGMSFVVSSTRAGDREAAEDRAEDEAEEQVERGPQPTRGDVEELERPQLVRDDRRDERDEPRSDDRQPPKRHDLESGRGGASARRSAPEARRRSWGRA